jgi:hypothetical protein
LFLFHSCLIILGTDQFVNTLCHPEELCDEGSRVHLVYTNYCVTEILRFALNDTMEKVDVSEILRFALDDNRD